MNPDQLVDALSAVVTEATGAGPVRIEGLRRLSGGASRETWSFDARLAGGETRPLILRRDPPGAPKTEMEREGRLLEAAGAAGVPVPGVVVASNDPEMLGSPFLIMQRIPGETIPRRILRDDAYAEARPLLAAQCGRILARIHQIRVDEVMGLTEEEPVSTFRGHLDTLGQPHPAFELGLRWLAANRPPARPVAVVHGDFRNGNFVVGPEGIRSILDWELVHLGDPLEDLGWLCVKAWRFGVDRRVGGFGDVDELVDAYERESGEPVDRDALRWWEAMGTLKWGVMCIMQASVHTAGLVRSVELAAIGRRVCENEWDLLDLLPPPWGGQDRSPASAGGRDQPPIGLSPHDVPSAAELVEAVREFLERDVMAATEGRVQFHTRVAANVLGMVGRELTLGPGQAIEHAAALAGLGVASEAELAGAIRSAAVDDRLADVAAVVRSTVAAKLAVANPRYLEG